MEAETAESEVEPEPEPKYKCCESITGFILCTLPLHHEGDHRWETNGREYSAPRSAKELKQLPSRQRPRPQPQPPHPQTQLPLPLPHQLASVSQPPPAPKSSSQPSTSQPAPRQPELGGDPPTSQASCTTARRWWPRRLHPSCPVSSWRYSSTCVPRWVCPMVRVRTIGLGLGSGVRVS